MWGPASAPFAGFGFLSILGVFILGILFLVVIALKGYALWNAAKRDEKAWFVALLILNTAGILELVYLIFIVKKWHKGAKSGTIGANESPASSSNQNGNGSSAN